VPTSTTAYNHLRTTACRRLFMYDLSVCERGAWIPNRAHALPTAQLAWDRLSRMINDRNDCAIEFNGRILRPQLVMLTIRCVVLISYTVYVDLLLRCFAPWYCQFIIDTSLLSTLLKLALRHISQGRVKLPTIASLVANLYRCQCAKYYSNKSSFMLSAHEPYRIKTDQVVFLSFLR